MRAGELNKEGPQLQLGVSRQCYPSLGLSRWQRYLVEVADGELDAPGGRLHKQYLQIEELLDQVQLFAVLFGEGDPSVGVVEVQYVG